MSSYRIVVEKDGKQVNQGTAWLVEGTDKVVTALHVVGHRKKVDNWAHVWTWWHECNEGDVGYFLDVDASTRLQLQPDELDRVADVALLRLENPADGLQGLVGLTVSNTRLERFRDWYSDGYWANAPRDQTFSLTGHIAAVPGDHSANAVQLKVSQGTDCTWTGMSGSPVRDADTNAVIAVLTQETSNASTLWAAHINAVKRLLGWEVEREEAPSRPEHLPPTAHLSPAIFQWFLKDTQGALDAAQQHLDEDRHEEALGVCDRELNRIEDIGVDPRHNSELAQHWLDARLLRAACLLNLQNIDAAGEQARMIDHDIQELGGAYLDHHPRPILLAQILSQAGDLDRASELVRDRPGEVARAVRQHIEISRGHMPDDWDDLVAEPFVRLCACDLLLDKDEHDRAVSETLNILHQQDFRPSYRAKAISVLLRAMHDSFHGRPLQAPRLEAQRKRLAIAELRRYLDPARPLLEGFMPHHILEPWIAGFQRLSWDWARVAQACERLREREIEDPSCHPETAESNGPPVEADDAPVWLRLMHEANRLHADGNTDQALDVISRALSEYPERALLERSAARFHLAKGQPEQAAAHAKRAFDAFPGHGQAILWAQMLHAADDPKTLWEELHDELHGSPNLDALRMLAWAASFVEPARARDYWEKVIETGQTIGQATGQSITPQDRIHLAQAMALSGDLAGAADVAWQACEPMLGGELEQAGADETCVAICARLQWGNGSLEREARLHRLAHALWQIGEKRASRTAQIEYLDLWRQLDSPDELPAPEFRRLLEEGLLVQVRREEFQQIVTGHQTQLRFLYLNGSLTLEDLARQLAREDVELFERILQQDEPLRAPVPPIIDPVALPGREILLGSFELAILDHLQLLSALPDALGPDGRLLVFQDVYRRMLEAPATLASRESPQQLARMRALAELIGRSGIVTEKAPDDHTALEWATARGAVLISASRAVHAASADVVSLSHAAQWLQEKGHLSKPQVAELREHGQPADIDAEVRARLEQAGSVPWVFDESALHVLLRAELARDIFRRLPGQVAITRSAQMWLYRTIEDMDLMARARERAQRIQQYLIALQRDGRLRPIERPDVNLPPAKDAPRAQVRRAWLQRALSWRRALLEHPEAWLVSADSLCVDGLTRTAPADLYTALDLGTPGDISSLKAPLHQVEERVTSIVSLCRVLTQGSPRDDVAEKLALLGFSDAYTAEDLAGYAERYSGLDGVRPREILERVEGRRRRGSFAEHMWYQGYIGTLYARTVFAAWCSDEPSRLRENITSTLLGRMLELDGAGRYSILRGFFGCLCGLVATYPEHSCVYREGDLYVLSLEESKAGPMWRAIDQWSSAQPDGARDRLCAIFHQEAGLLLRNNDESFCQEPLQLRIRVAPLVLAADVFQHRTTVNAPGSLLDAISVLSALWPPESRPLRHPAPLDENRSVSLEEWLIHGGALVAHDSSSIMHDGVALRVQIPGSSHHLSCAPAALFLRSPIETRSRLATIFVRHFGPDDGRIVRALHKLAENPEDPEALQDYAHTSVLPPWQSFRLHPESIAEWGTPMCAGLFPSTLSELRELLSEPGPLPHDKELHEILLQRAIEGAWRGRQDVLELLKRSGELIAEPWLPLLWRESNEALHLGESLGVLEHAHDHPSARLAFHMLVCIIAASEPSIDSETRQRVVTLVEQLTEQAARPLTADTLAACEPHLMHHAMWTVRILNPRSSVRDVLWLTESLYLWMVRQLQALSREQREAHLRTLRALSPERPGFTLRASPIFLDPTRFGQNKLDIRLLLILRTLAYLEPGRIKLLATNRLRHVLEQLGRRPCTNEESEVRALPATAMPRSWADLPRTVPELAAHVLHNLGTPRKNKARRTRSRKKRRRGKRT